MTDQNLVENVLCSLSKSTRGKSPKLFHFFSLDPKEYETILPLTKLQKDIVMDSMLNPHRSIYNVAQSMEHYGLLDPELWKAATEFVVNQEPVLRSMLVKKDTIIFQAVKEKIIPAFEYLDLSDKDLSNEVISRIIEDRIKKPYDELLNRIFCRYLLVKCAEEKYTFVISSHLLRQDAGSSKSLFAKISRVYIHLRDNKHYPKYEPSLFNEYIFYNYEHFDSPGVITFWEQKLKGVGELVFYSSLINESDNYICKKLPLTDADFFAIKKYCIAKRITPAFYFKMLFGILVNYYFKPQGDFLFLENVHGRKKEYLNSIGVFFHPFPIKILASLFRDNVSFDEYIQYFRDYRKETESYDEISMGALNTIIRQQGVRVIYNYLNLSDVKELLRDSVIVTTENIGNKNEVQFFVEEREKSFELQLLYHESSFADNNFLKRLINISNQLITISAIDLRALEFIMQEEKNEIQQFYKVNPAAVQTRSFDKLFENQVLKSPGSIAVRFEDSQWSYSELNEKANQLAHYFKESYKIGTGDIIGVWMERSHFSLAAMLAIFKLGAVYLPIDDDLPQERANFILEDANPSVVIINSSIIRKVKTSKENVFVIDLQLKRLSTPSVDLNLNHSSRDIAYIIYTSGTTGTPKGVAIEHMGMINHVAEKIDYLKIDNQSVVAQTAKSGFDISIWQFIAALYAGGTTVIYSNETVYDIENFLEKAENDQISIMEVVPSFLKAMISAMCLQNERTFSALKYLLVTGDIITVDLANAWLSKFASIGLINAYGPTEASDDITHFNIKTPLKYTSVPIGKPINNIKIYIVDENNRLCPVGFKGQIHVSGICVARGYLNNQKKTDEVFIKDNFSENQQFRLYKTGDLGCWLPDGNILFHGREDAQVKIRGNRVELEEIENILYKIEEITEAVVVDKEDNNGEKYLVAYVQSREKMPAEYFRKFIAKRLPIYMIPSLFVEIDQWPLNTNGKIDRQALKDLQDELIVSSYKAPGNRIEEKLSNIWEEVLGKSRISVNANFFELGGHSLKAMQLVSRIHELFDQKLDLKQVFNNPTIEELGKIIASAKWVDKIDNKEKVKEIVL